MPCSYCGLPGCSIDTCEQRLEDYHGTPEDRDETLEEMDESHWVDYKEDNQ